MISGPVDGPIILASDRWHQGVSGIVASRLADKFGVPAVIICVVDGWGRGSCRSANGFNVFGALENSASLLESYGGHELAAGLTIDVERLPEFREQMRAYYKERAGEARGLVLDIDYEVDNACLLTLDNVQSLWQNEPWGGGNPPPLLCLRGVVVESVTPIGGDKHLKMRVWRDGRALDCVFFSKTVRELGLRGGNRADVAFEASINEFRGSRSVQLLLRDARPSRVPDDGTVALCLRFFGGETLTAEERESLIPGRQAMATVWRSLTRHPGAMAGNSRDVLRELAAQAGVSCGKVTVCLHVFEELGIAEVHFKGDNVSIYPDTTGKKVNLQNSRILERLRG